MHDRFVAPIDAYAFRRWREAFSSTKIPALGLGFICHQIQPIRNSVTQRSIRMHLGPHKSEQLRRSTSCCALYIIARLLCCFWRRMSLSQLVEWYSVCSICIGHCHLRFILAIDGSASSWLILGKAYEGVSTFYLTFVFSPFIVPYWHLHLTRDYMSSQTQMVSQILSSIFLDSVPQEVMGGLRSM